MKQNLFVIICYIGLIAIMLYSGVVLLYGVNCIGGAWKTTPNLCEFLHENT